VVGKVKVLYFAQARDLAGRTAEYVALEDGTTARAFLSSISKSHKGLAAIAESLRLAVNEEIVPSDSPLRDGDVVAVLPPVAGG